MARKEGGGETADEQAHPKKTVVEVIDPKAQVSELEQLITATNEVAGRSLTAVVGEDDSNSPQIPPTPSAEFFTDFPTAKEIAEDIRSHATAAPIEAKSPQLDLHVIVRDQVVFEREAILEKLTQRAAETPPQELSPENVLAREALLANPDRLNDLAWCINKLVEVLNLYHQPPQAAGDVDDHLEYPSVPPQPELTQPQSKLRRRLRTLYIAQLTKFAESSFPLISKWARAQLEKLRLAKALTSVAHQEYYERLSPPIVEITEREEDAETVPTLEPAVRRAHSALLLKYMIADGAVAQDLRLLTMADLVHHFPQKIYIGDKDTTEAQIDARLAGYDTAWSAVIEASDPKPLTTLEIVNALVAEYARATGIITQNLEQVLPQFLLTADFAKPKAKRAYRKAVLGHDGRADKDREARELWERTLMVLTALCFFRGYSKEFANLHVEQLQQKVIDAYKKLVETSERRVVFQADPLQNLHGVELFFAHDLSDFAKYMDSLAANSPDHPRVPVHFKRMIPLWSQAGQDNFKTYGTLLNSMMHIIIDAPDQTATMTLEERIAVALSYSDLDSRLQAVLRPLLLERAKKTVSEKVPVTETDVNLANAAATRLKTLCEHLRTANGHSQLFGIYLCGIGRTVPEIIEALSEARQQIETQFSDLATSPNQETYNKFTDTCDTTVEATISYMWAHASAELNPTEMPASAPFDAVFIQKSINTSLKQFTNSHKLLALKQLDNSAE